LLTAPPQVLPSLKKSGELPGAKSSVASADRATKVVG
jgi:hypothetical protein